MRESSNRDLREAAQWIMKAIKRLMTNKNYRNIIIIDIVIKYGG